MANAVKLKELLTYIKGRLDSIEFDSEASLSKSKGAVETKAQQMRKINRQSKRNSSHLAITVLEQKQKSETN